MRKPSLALLGLILLGFVLSACAGGPPVQPLSYRSAPWSAGEVSQYDLRDRNGNAVGTASWTWERTASEWQQHYEVVVNNVPDRGVVVVADDLKPLRSSREVGGKRYETTYSPKTIDITTTAADGTTTTRSLPVVGDAIDNDASLQVQRALPFAPNYATQYTDVIPTTAATAPIVLTVTGAETVTVPAGTFPTWHVKMAFTGSAHDGWYQQQPPYALVKYQNQASGASFVLTHYDGVAAVGTPQAAAAAAATPVTPSTTTSSGPAEMPPINPLLLIVMLGIQVPLMIGLPILLGWAIKRRYGISWGVFGLGMLSFVLSQIGHIPFNFAVGLAGLPLRGLGLLPTLPLGLAAGLSAALFEQGARLLVLLLIAKRVRGWRAALQLGAGHGGVESILLGLSVLLSVVNILATHGLGPATQALPPEALAQLMAVQSAFWGQSAALPFISVFERICAMILHVALSVLVVRSITRRQPLYFLAAVALHTLFDAWTVWGRPLGVLGIEAVLGVAAVFLLWVIWRLREQPAATAGVLSGEPSDRPVPTAVATAEDLSERQLSPEELARRAERSRYE